MKDGSFDFNRSFGFVLHETARLLSKRYDQRSKSLGLTRAQCQVLAYLVYHEGINQAGLAELLELEPISLGRLVDRMAQAGWVERRPDPQDRRAWQLFITEKAKPLFVEMVAIGREVRAEALAGFTPEEGDRIMELLLRARHNLSAHTADPGQSNTNPRPLAGAAE
ncbi:MAG TPA: MarR family transcriptional regulator [Stellaceae bacterium]|nr:MarR family transcriptional regulator [Stellaceae bacterium]